MNMFRALKSNNSSKDANCFAPCTCDCKNKFNIIRYTDIALAVSVLFCLAIIIISGIKVIDIIIGIIIISIIIIRSLKVNEKAVNQIV